MFTSRRQKLIKCFLIIKDAERRNLKKHSPDNDHIIQKGVTEVKSLNVDDDILKEMEIEKYFK